MGNQISMLLFRNEPYRIPAPDGYFIRTLKEGDLSDTEGWLHANYTLWKSLHTDPWTPEWFEKNMLGDPDCVPDRIFLICRSSDGAIAGTATAKFGKTPSLHEVGIAEEFMGRHLSLSLCAAPLDYMIERGAHRIQLLTDEFRRPAIKTYLRLGFRPWFYKDDMPERWAGVFRDMGLPAADYFAYDELSHRKVAIPVD